MGAGNCYPAAWNAINTIKNDDWVVVHALRDIFKGANHFGGHAFLLNKKTNTIRLLVLSMIAKRTHL